MHCYKSSDNLTNKSAFTLIELSIVILVVAVMVASLLVGRAIIERATTQRIIYKEGMVMQTHGKTARSAETNALHSAHHVPSVISHAHSAA